MYARVRTRLPVCIRCVYRGENLRYREKTLDGWMSDGGGREGRRGGRWTKGIARKKKDEREKKR
jgi:hypothetical protein